MIDIECTDCHDTGERFDVTGTDLERCHCGQYEELEAVRVEAEYDTIPTTWF